MLCPGGSQNIHSSAACVLRRLFRLFGGIGQIIVGFESDHFLGREDGEGLVRKTRKTKEEQIGWIV